MPNKQLLSFIKEARKRGFEDYQIREPLLKKGWTASEVKEAFSALKPELEDKNKVCIYLDSEILARLQRRARKNLLTLPEQVEDILRRSCLNLKPGTSKENIDDMLITLFSRRKYKK
jgi:hypothetical protein